MLLSPILARWGLQLTFDEDQPAGERDAGCWARACRSICPDGWSWSAGGDARCSPAGSRRQCRIGRGRALIVADAAVFEDAGAGGLPVRRAALEALLAALASD